MVCPRSQRLCRYIMISLVDRLRNPFPQVSTADITRLCVASRGLVGGSGGSGSVELDLAALLSRGAGRLDIFCDCPLFFRGSARRRIRNQEFLPSCGALWGVAMAQKVAVSLVDDLSGSQAD